MNILADELLTLLNDASMGIREYHFIQVNATFTYIKHSIYCNNWRTTADANYDVVFVIDLSLN